MRVIHTQILGWADAVREGVGSNFLAAGIHLAGTKTICLGLPIILPFSFHQLGHLLCPGS